MNPARSRHSLYVPGALLLAVLATLLFACDGQQVTVTRLVEVTRLVTAPAAAGEENANPTRLVVVTATPSPPDVASAAPAFTTEDPTHYRALVENGPLTLDPALATDVASRHLIRNVVEPLLVPDYQDRDKLLPLLASRWLTGEDTFTFTFLIRRGVSFSNGNELTASDVAYTFQRGLLQSTPGTPFSMLVPPLLGYSSGDITEEIDNGAHAGDRDALLANAPVRDLLAVCESVKAAIVADDTAGSVTFTLARSWAPLPAALSQPWAGIIDREWATAQGAWDGSCETWGAWYAPQSGESLLATRIMGTGPYTLDHWTPGTEYVLVRNDDYWRPADPPVAPAGPAIQTVAVRQEPAADLRWQALRSGSVETAELAPGLQPLAEAYVGEICDWSSGQCRPGTNANSPLRQYTGLTLPDRQALFFNFGINPDDNPFIGTGQLDGNGVPPDFFSDQHIRRAFAHCFDEERFAEIALDGNGRPAATLLPGYYASEGGLPAPPAYDLELCAEELAAAWDNLLPATGFWLQIPYESGDYRQQQVALLLQEGLRAVGDNYHVELVGLARPVYLQRYAEGKLPLAVLSWTAALPDPHSWVAPPFADEVLSFQRLPSDLRARFTALIDEGLSTLEPAERLSVYRTVEVQRQAALPHLLLPQATGSHYEQRWVEGWSYHPSLPEPYYYTYSLDGG